MSVSNGLEFSYDFERDVMTIEGIQYSGDLFRCFGIRTTAPHELMRIVKREDGVLTVQTVHDKELSHRFELVAKAGVAA
jgi:hypothetical protein